MTINSFMGISSTLKLLINQLLYYLQKQKRKLQLIWQTLHMTRTIINSCARYRSFSYFWSFVLYGYKGTRIVSLPFSPLKNLLTILKQLNVLELFLDCMTEPNERLVEFGVGGICNSCVGKYSNLTLFADPKKS